MAKNWTQFADEANALVADPDVFDQQTGELSNDIYLRTTVIAKENVNLIPEIAQEKPEFQHIADAIVSELLENYGKSEVHTILALAGAVSLPREVLSENVNSAPQLYTALNSVAMFHMIASDVVEEIGPPLISEEDDFFDGLEAAGFTEVAPGVWVPTDEPQR